MKKLLAPLLAVSAAGVLHAQTLSTGGVFSSTEDFDRYARKLRESALSSLEPQVFVPTTSGNRMVSGRYAWRTDIITTVFWAGENASTNNPVHNRSSSWDSNWAANFGGFDNPDPSARKNYLPVAFTPRLNPFYVALPYNDVSLGHFKPEASQVIPWYRETVERDGKSVCRDRWVAIRKGNLVCYAQWSDCGPFRTDHHQYVFGNERPKPNLNGGAGLDVSPAVRDFLQMGNTDVTAWKFVEARDVPNGPWARLGDNNNVAQRLNGGTSAVVNAAPAPTQKKRDLGKNFSSSEPVVITR